MLKSTRTACSAQKLLVTQRMREREGKEFIPGRIIWDEVTRSGPANFPIQPPGPIKGPLGWKKWFHENHLQDSAKTVDQGLFALKVKAALEAEFAKIEVHEIPVDEEKPVLIVHQEPSTERQLQTRASIPKDKYELQKFIDEKKALHASEMFLIEQREDFKLFQKQQYNSKEAGVLCQDARFVDDVLNEEEAGRLFGGQIAQSFILAWITMLFVSLVWRVK